MLERHKWYPHLPITAHLSHICVDKFKPRSVPQKLRIGTAMTSLIFFLFSGHSILLRGFRALLCLKATKHFSSKEVSNQAHQIKCPQTIIVFLLLFCLWEKLPLSECTDHRIKKPFLRWGETCYRNPTNSFTSWHTGYANSLAFADPACKTFCKWPLSIFSFAISLLIGANFSITASATTSL